MTNTPGAWPRSEGKPRQRSAIADPGVHHQAAWTRRFGSSRATAFRTRPPLGIVLFPAPEIVDATIVPQLEGPGLIGFVAHVGQPSALDHKAMNPADSEYLRPCGSGPRRAYAPANIHDRRGAELRAREAQDACGFTATFALRASIL